MSRLSHSQHEIEGILQCSEPEEALSDSADELVDPAGREPAAGPETNEAGQRDQPDIEDMGALAHDLQDAGIEEQQHQQQLTGEAPLFSGTSSLISQHHSLPLLHMFPQKQGLTRYMWFVCYQLYPG